VIAQSNAPAELIRAWHATPEDRYDFNSGSQRIEVKSSSSRTRQHRFALEQLHPPVGTSLLIASVFVERAGGGVSVMNLVDEIRSHIRGQTELLLRLESTVAATLGDNWRAALDERFDRQLGQGSLRFYESAAIPSVDPELPDGVSDVAFKSDLSEVESVERDVFRQMGGLFAAALC